MDFDPVVKRRFQNLTDPEFFKYAVEQKMHMITMN